MGQNRKKINSRGFAALLQDKIDHGVNINFIIGGAHGVSQKLLTTSQLILSASELTFPHRLFKIFLMEQILELVQLIEIILIINNDF